MRINRKLLIAGVAILVTALVLIFSLRDREDRGARLQVGTDEDVAAAPKIYWFIPDGFRADPEVFNIFQWAREGEMPNLRKMMQAGSYGYSLPVFPGHTPTNFATLFTGSNPDVHGVADGPMRLEKYPLSVVSKSGFSSHAKRVPPIWYTLEELGYRVALLSVPGSTPPELDRGITLRGRWGGWGIDFASTIFHAASDRATRHRQGLENRLFENSVVLTRYVDAAAPAGWSSPPRSFSTIREVELENWGFRLFGALYDSTDDGRENYDRIRLSTDRSDTWADLAVGDWSEWVPVSLTWQTGNDYNLFTPKKTGMELGLTNIEVDSHVKVRVIRLGERDFFRIRFLYDGLNRFVVKPPEMADRVRAATGPMVDFVDNFPPQMIHYPEDKDAFMEEAMMSLQWHAGAARFFARQSGSDVIIHDVYTPNQFLTSRWWMKYLDPASRRFNEVDETSRAALWREARRMYRGVDDILGEVLDSLDENSYLVFSSDHGVVPLDTRVRLNNLFAREGLLRFKVDRETGYPQIDWANTRVVFLKMHNIYIDPNGLDGNYERASGAEYEQLRDRVINLLSSLEDGPGGKPLDRVLSHEEASIMNLPGDRTGDLIVANRAGYGWSEEITEDLEIFSESISSGYKQAVDPPSSKGMLTPFVVVGPGVRKNHALTRVIRHIDQYPTIMRLLDREPPGFVQGRVIEELFEDPGQDSAGALD